MFMKGIAKHPFCVIVFTGFILYICTENLSTIDNYFLLNSLDLFLVQRKPEVKTSTRNLF